MSSSQRLAIKVVSSRFQKLSIIIPVFNEIATIGKVLLEIEKVPLLIDKEIIVVDDYSSDGTREFLKDKKNINLVLHERNTGKGGAVHTGIQTASGDIVLIQDADLEYSPYDYERLLEPIMSGQADVVYGSRFLNKANQYGFFSFWANKLLTFLTRRLSGLPVTDMETCYKVFRADLIKNVFLVEKRFGFEPEITMKIAAQKDVRYKEVPVSYYARTQSEGKKIGWRDGVKALWCLFVYRPLRKKQL